MVLGLFESAIKFREMIKQILEIISTFIKYKYGRFGLQTVLPYLDRFIKKMKFAIRTSHSFYLHFLFVQVLNSQNQNFKNSFNSYLLCVILRQIKHEKIL